MCVADTFSVMSFFWHSRIVYYFATPKADISNIKC